MSSLNAKRKRETADLVRFLKSLGNEHPCIPVYAKGSGDMVFMKGDVFIKVTVVRSHQNADRLVNNLDLAMNIDSPHVCKVLYNRILELPSITFHAVATRMAGVSIKSYNTRNIPGDDFLIMFRDILTGVRALHSAGLFHGDIHLTNVVRNAMTGRWALIDFDFALPVQDVRSDRILFHAGFPKEHLPIIPLARNNGLDRAGTKALIDKFMVRMQITGEETLKFLDEYQVMAMLMYGAMAIDSYICKHSVRDSVETFYNVFIDKSGMSEHNARELRTIITASHGLMHHIESHCLLGKKLDPEQVRKYMEVLETSRLNLTNLTSNFEFWNKQNIPQVTLKKDVEPHPELKTHLAGHIGTKTNIRAMPIE